MLTGMRQIARLTAPALIVALAAALPLSAQEAEPEPEGRSLIEEGAQLFLRGLLQEMEPGINDLQDLADGIGPALEGFADHMGQALVQIMRVVDDIQNYEQPEFLSNGDIIIRRKPDAPAWEPPELPEPEDGAEPGAQIDL